MTFPQWLDRYRYDEAQLTDTQREHLMAAWKAEESYEGRKHGAADPHAVAALVTKYVDKVIGGEHANRVRAVGQQALNEGWTEDATELALLREARKGGSLHAAGFSGGAQQQDVLATALLLTADSKIESDLEKSGVPHHILEAARAPHLRGFNIKGLVRMALGEPIAGDINENHIKRAFTREGMMAGTPSTISAPAILADSANKVAAAAYVTAPAPWRTFASIRSTNDFRTHTAIRPTYAATAKEVAPGGEVEHGNIADESYTYSVKTYARQLQITRAHIINDDVGLFTTSDDHNTLFGLIRGAARALNNLVAETILANTGSFWSTGNANYFEGASTNLSATSLGTALQTLRKMKDSENSYLDLKPAAILVPGELEQIAAGLLGSAELLRNVSSADQLPTGNMFKGLLTLAIDPRLSDASFSGNSATAWWVFAANSASVVVAFLNGQERPSMDFFDFDHDIRSLTMGWRVYHDFGCALGDKRHSVKSKGAA